MKKNLVNLTKGWGILCFLTPMFSAHAENSLKETETSFDLSCVYQNERISGTVVDQEGNPVIGANVISKWYYYRFKWSIYFRGLSGQCCFTSFLYRLPNTRNRTRRHKC